MPAAEPKIELREVSLALDGKAVLEQLSLHIPADGVTCLTCLLYTSAAHGFGYC